jgi:hypothetical protein
MLFQQFDRLLLYAGGGKTVHFFLPAMRLHKLHWNTPEKKMGSAQCSGDFSPAGYMLDATGAAHGSHADIDGTRSGDSHPKELELLWRFDLHDI